MTWGEAANLAVNQTLMRSINTSVIALLPVAGLLFVGAGLLGVGTLKDLALVLFVGLAAGAYSSIFLATPIVADLKEREPEQHRAAPAGPGPPLAGGRAGAAPRCRPARSPAPAGPVRRRRHLGGRARRAGPARRSRRPTSWSSRRPRCGRSRGSGATAAPRPGPARSVPAADRSPGKRRR